MKMIRKSFSMAVFFMLIFSFAISLSAAESASFMLCELYTAEEYENLPDMELSTLARTSDFSWKDQNGASPKMKQEKAVLLHL